MLWMHFKIAIFNTICKMAIFYIKNLLVMTIYISIIINNTKKNNYNYPTLQLYKKLIQYKVKSYPTKINSIQLCQNII